MRTVRSLTMGGVPTRVECTYPGGVYLSGGCTSLDRVYLPRYSPSPCGQIPWHTLLKILPCSNFVAGGNKCDVLELN